MLSGPIIIIEDDLADQEILVEALKQLSVKNDLILLRNGEEALEWLCTATTQPFLILCDVNLPRINGPELRAAINKNDELRRKSIPFVFYSTSSSPQEVRKAYEESVQGYFLKGHSFKEICDTLHLIVTYWKHCIHPNSMR